ncbi:MAG: PIN domain-containing protein [Chloroflexota bacterium]|nr:PIN domain-containing protein [Chloroflexota bacterium]
MRCGSSTSSVAVVPSNEYAGALAEAYRRVPRDPRDASTVALAPTVGCAILTVDYDFCGCGVPVWTVETLLLHLEADAAS